MVDKKIKKSVTVKDRRRRRRKRSGNKHQCYYKVKGRYMTPKQAAKARRKRRFGKPG